MTVRSEAGLRQAASKAMTLLEQADANFQELRFLTDDELRSRMHEQASAEKAAIRAALDAGRVYVIAGKDARRVHFHDCPSLREQVDRDRAWSRWLQGEVEDFRQAVAHGDGGPRMPELLSRTTVEALSTYVTCQVCSPTLSHVRKRHGERTTKLTSLTSRHVSRSLNALDGTWLGQLQRIVTTVDAQGSTIEIETTVCSFTENQHAAVLVGPPANDTHQ